MSFIVWTVSMLLLGSLVRYFVASPRSFARYVLEDRGTVTVKQKRIMFERMLKLTQNFWFIVGIVAAIFNLSALLSFIIGMQLVYIVKIIPEIRREVQVFNDLQNLVDQLIADFIGKDKETNEKA